MNTPPAIVQPWTSSPAQLKAPFPWFGGKRRVADQVWGALGSVDNYVEPFAGSLAVLLGRPTPFPGAETVNDADAYLANFWRALAADPESVAAHCDWPVNECDLFARHLWLVNSGRERMAKMEQDPEFYDAKVAGWWVWGINQWIGGGWCSGGGPWKLPHLGDEGQGVNRKLPHLGNEGQGVNRKLPHLGNEGQALLEYFQALAGRLRRVRVCCGDWSRVVTDGALSFGGRVGVFLDPPYDEDERASGCYNTDGKGQRKLSSAVRDWAVARGEDTRLRIVLAGYYEEHAGGMPSGWRVVRYKANAAYQRTSTAGQRERGNNANRHRECLWFSPSCLDLEPMLL